MCESSIGMKTTSPDNVLANVQLTVCITVEEAPVPDCRFETQSRV
jgi:hypothetical protein